jgi:predicted glycoside hydrolase/deacetylase ChbG (UPF0249 family)
MIVAVQGTKNFNDYAIFLRAMGTAMSQMDSEDNELKIFSAGPVNVNVMATEFVNVSERSFKGRGKKIKLVKVPPSWIDDNLADISYFAFFSKPKEDISYQVKNADAKSVNVGVYRY